MSFVIFASPKSGTTWLQQLVSNHPDALCAESRPFGDYFATNSPATPHLTVEKFCGLLGNHFAPTIPGLERNNRKFQRELAYTFLDGLAKVALAVTKKTVYGEKFTPYRGTAAQAVESLRDYNPRLKFVNLTRDGRDVIASGAAQWLNMRLRNASADERANWEHLLAERTILPEDFEMFLDYWIDAAQAGLAARKLFPDYLHLSYEQFVEDPFGQAAALFDFLRLKSSSSIVRSCVEAASFDRLSNGRKRGDEDPNSFFRKGVVGDWKNWFTPDQESMFEKSAGALMTRLGYELGAIYSTELLKV